MVLSIGAYFRAFNGNDEDGMRATAMLVHVGLTKKRRVKV
jgi:hypothetical protein